MKTFLIITTPYDTSLPLFFTAEILHKIEIKVCHFSDIHPSLLKQCDADYVYFRDPFHGKYTLETIRSAIEVVRERFPKAYYLDSISSFEDISLEDKWLQYQKYGQFMPETFLFEPSEPYPENTLFKKRISSRSKGIHFNPKDVPPIETEFIAQKRVRVENEFRVFVVADTIIDEVAVRQSKNENTATKNLHVEPITPELLHFVKKIQPIVAYDFYGLDIIYASGKYHLLEVNRSPQWISYFSLTNNNLASLLIDTLIKKL